MELTPRDYAALSPLIWNHVNPYGRVDLDMNSRLAVLWSIWRLVPRVLGLPRVRMVEPPREIKGFTYFMAWHSRLMTEPAHGWFRDQLRMAARSIRTKQRSEYL